MSGKQTGPLGHYTAYNAQAIDSWVQDGWEWGTPITSEVYQRARAGDWQVVLTPNLPVPRDWFGELSGKKVLGLASGGGQQMPIFAATGAICTVFDLSTQQLESERLVAAREGYQIDIIQGDMTLPLPFPDRHFDLIFHPVSNCYIRDVHHVWRECHRILRPGGRLLSGLDNGINFLFDDDSLTIAHRLPFDSLSQPQWQARVLEEGLQFSHPIEDQIGGQLKAGLQLLDVYEDSNNSGPLQDFNVPTFFATLAIKPA